METGYDKPPLWSQHAKQDLRGGTGLVGQESGDFFRFSVSQGGAETVI